MDSEINKVKEIVTALLDRALCLLEDSEKFYDYQKIFLCEYVASLTSVLKILEVSNKKEYSNYHIMFLVKQFMEFSFISEDNLRRHSISLDVH